MAYNVKKMLDKTMFRFFFKKKSSANLSKNRKDIMVELPFNMQEEVLSYLSLDDLKNGALVSTDWKKITRRKTQFSLQAKIKNDHRPIEEAIAVAEARSAKTKKAKWVIVLDYIAILLFPLTMIMLMTFYIAGILIKPITYAYRKTAKSLYGILFNENRLQNIFRFGSSLLAVLGGSIGGALLGATIGSTVPIIGTAVGAIIGGILGALYAPFISVFFTTNLWGAMVETQHAGKLNPRHPEKYCISPEGIENIQKKLLSTNNQLDKKALKKQTEEVADVIYKQTKEVADVIYKGQACAKALKNYYKSLFFVPNQNALIKINSDIKEMRKGNLELARFYQKDKDVTYQKQSEAMRFQFGLIFLTSDMRLTTSNEVLDDQFKADMAAYKHQKKNI
jgi:hypothetical protein